MVKRGRNRKNPPRPSPQQQPKKKRFRRRAPTTRRSSLANLIVTGVKSLISVLPASSALLPLADAAFKYVGISNSLTSSSKEGVTAYSGDVQVYGLASATILFPANIVAHSPTVAKCKSTDETSPKLAFKSNFIDGKILSCTIHANIDSSQGHRNGRWAMAFVPFRSDADVSEFKNSYRHMTVPQLESMPNSTNGTVNQALTLTVVPRASDGKLFQYIPLNDAFGALVVSYTQENRVSYADITAEEFSPNISISGKVSLRHPLFETDNKTFEDSTSIIGPELTVLERNASTGYYSTLHFAKYRCTRNKTTNCCSISNAVLYSTIDLSLDGMALE